MIYVYVILIQQNHQYIIKYFFSSYSPEIFVSYSKWIVDHHLRANPTHLKPIFFYLLSYCSLMIFSGISAVISNYIFVLSLVHFKAIGVLY